MRQTVELQCCLWMRDTTLSFHNDSCYGVVPKLCCCYRELTPEVPISGTNHIFPDPIWEEGKAKNQTRLKKFFQRFCNLKNVFLDYFRLHGLIVHQGIHNNTVHQKLLVQLRKLFLDPLFDSSTQKMLEKTLLQQTALCFLLTVKEFLMYCWKRLLWKKLVLQPM